MPCASRQMVGRILKPIHGNRHFLYVHYHDHSLTNTLQSADCAPPGFVLVIYFQTRMGFHRGCRWLQIACHWGLEMNPTVMNGTVILWRYLNLVLMASEGREVFHEPSKDSSMRYRTNARICILSSNLVFLKVSLPFRSNDFGVEDDMRFQSVFWDDLLDIS